MTGILFYVYYTIWNLMFILFHKWTYKYINLLLSSILVAVTAFVIFYIHPGMCVVHKSNPVESYAISDNKTLIILDIFTHWIPLIFILYMYGSYYIKNTTGIYDIITILIFLIYMILFNPLSIYRIKIDHLIISVYISAILYGSLLFFK